MKNITLSVDADVLAAVRRYAAEQQVSVNALVRAYLTDLATREDRAKQARQHIKRLSERSNARVGEASWRRSELHER